MNQEIKEVYKSVPVLADKVAHLQTEFTKAILRDDISAAEQTLVKAVKMFDAHFGKDELHNHKKSPVGETPRPFPVNPEQSRAHAALMVANLFNVSVGVEKDVTSGFMPKVKVSSLAIIDSMMGSGTGPAEIVGRAARAWHRMEMNF